MTVRGSQHWSTQTVVANLVRLCERWGKPDEVAVWRTRSRHAITQSSRSLRFSHH